jgi:hypothetical protein
LDTALKVDRTMDLEECRVIQQRIDNFSTVRVIIVLSIIYVNEIRANSVDDVKFSLCGLI